MRCLLFGLFVLIFIGELKGKTDVLSCRRRLEKLKYTDSQQALRYVDSLRATGEWQREGNEFWLDMMEMGVYEVMSWDYLAVMYGERLLGQDSVQKSDAYFFIVVNALVSGCFKAEKYEKVLKYADLLLERGQRAEDEWSVAAAYFAVGQVKWRLHEREKAREWFDRAMELLEHRKRTGSVMLLSYVYGEVMGCYTEEEDYEGALAIGKRREELIGLMEGYGGHEEYIDQQKGYLYAKMACICYKLEKKEQARDYFRRFRETYFSTLLEGRFYMIPYLRLSGEAGKVIRILEGIREEVVACKEDSVNRDVVECMGNLAWACAKQGDYRKAYGYAVRERVLVDSLGERMRKKSLMELNVVYEVKDREVCIQEQKAVIVRKKLYVEMLAGGLGVLLLCLLGVAWHVYRIRQKNRKLMEQMEEKLAYREKWRSRREEAVDGQVPDKLYELFQRFEYLMQEERLFLSSALGRDEVVARLFTNKNHLSAAIRLYTKGSFTDYVNGLRLDYALELLRDERNYTMEAVAEKAGFGTVRSFYRIFKEKYSVSPANYKCFLKKY